MSFCEAFVPAWTTGEMPLSPEIASLSSKCPSNSFKVSTTSNNQEWDVDLYQTQHSFVFDYGTSLVDLLDPQPGEVIVDVGCGLGQLTSQIANRGSKAIGFDANSNMVERARQLYPTVEFFQADVASDFIIKWNNNERSEILVDAIFSNAALHWVKNADLAVASMAQILRPGGRFVVELGGKRNIDRIIQASYRVLGKTSTEQENPWYFPTIAEYSSLLEKYGIEVLSAHLYDRPTILDEGIDGMANWLRMFGGVLLDYNISPETKEETIQNIVNELLAEDNCMFDGEKWTADYRRLRIVGQKLP